MGDGLQQKWKQRNNNLCIYLRHDCFHQCAVCVCISGDVHTCFSLSTQFLCCSYSLRSIFIVHCVTQCTSFMDCMCLTQACPTTSYIPLVIKDTIPLPTCAHLQYGVLHVCGTKVGGGNGLRYHALFMQYYTLIHASELGVVVEPNHKGQLGHWNCTLWGGPVSEDSMCEGLCSS